MEYFYSGSGHRPYFEYRIQVPRCTDEMFMWCKNYEVTDRYFQRFHVEWGTSYEDRAYDIMQFEWKQAAIDFSLRWL